MSALRTKLAAIGATALVLGAGPMAAVPAQAAETHVCDQLFREGWEGPCKLALAVYCLVFPTQAICD